MDNFEEQLKKDLHLFLQSINEVDERMPECPDVEDKWEEIAKAYIPDGIREFQAFPSASLGWMMYIGMAVAKMWDTEWDIYSKIDDLYAYMRDKRGYDAMDEYIREEVLLLQGDDYTAFRFNGSFPLIDCSTSEILSWKSDMAVAISSHSLCWDRFLLSQ